MTLAQIFRSIPISYNLYKRSIWTLTLHSLNHPSSVGNFKTKLNFRKIRVLKNLSLGPRNIFLKGPWEYSSTYRIVGICESQLYNCTLHYFWKNIFYKILHTSRILLLCCWSCCCWCCCCCWLGGNGKCLKDKNCRNYSARAWQSRHRPSYDKLEFKFSENVFFSRIIGFQYN